MDDIIEEEINLQIHEAFKNEPESIAALKNESECIAIKRRIAAAKRCLLHIHRDLP
jgi:hypothetical protein